MLNFENILVVFVIITRNKKKNTGANAVPTEAMQFPGNRWCEFPHKTIDTIMVCGVYTN